ncbi:MAG: hypothetical protein JKY67_05840 [Pseudomonadales bacterium]|nr:hypothetical protein [Pseudomonadales bacterium]
MPEKCQSNINDRVDNKAQFLLFWGLPTLLMAITWLMKPSPLLTGTIWMGALGWMGLACLRNARQCGRVHCFFSGPYFLLAAVSALVVGSQWTQVLSINEFGLLLLIVSPLVCVLPEIFWGKYKNQKKT